MSNSHREDRPFNDPADSVTAYDFRVTKNSPAERDAARLRVAAEATEATDARQLLDALGLGQPGEIRSQLRRRAEKRRTTAA